MKKKLASILLSILFVLSFGACGESEERKQIEELKALISAQSQTIAELNGTLSSLQTSIQTQGESIEELQATVNAQAEEIKLLRFHADILAGLYTGDFYEIDEAYEQGFIDLEAVKNISYHMMGGLYTGDKDDETTWTKLEFTPKEETPVLDFLVEDLIKQTYFSQEKTLREIFDYYGEYNGCYAIVFKTVMGEGAGAIIKECEIEGIIHYDYYLSKIFVLKKI